MKRIRSLRLLFGSVVACFVMVLSPMPVFANQSPSGCNSNRLNLSIMKDKTSVMIGDTITYTIAVSNFNSGSDIACDITAASIDITLPAPDGTATGTVVNLATNINYPAGTTVTVVGSAQYVVATNPDVVDMIAKAEINGVLHDAPVDHSAQIIKTLGTSVVALPDTPGEAISPPTDELPPSYPNALPRTGK